MPHQHTTVPSLEQPDSSGPSSLEQMFSSAVHHLAACPPPWWGTGTPMELWVWKKPLTRSSPTENTAGYPG